MTDKLPKTSKRFDLPGTGRDDCIEVKDDTLFISSLRKSAGMILGAWKTSTVEWSNTMSTQQLISPIYLNNPEIGMKVIVKIKVDEEMSKTYHLNKEKVGDEAILDIMTKFLGHGCAHELVASDSKVQNTNASTTFDELKFGQMSGCTNGLAVDAAIAALEAMEVAKQNIAGEAKDSDNSGGNEFTKESLDGEMKSTLVFPNINIDEDAATKDMGRYIFVTGVLSKCSWHAIDTDDISLNTHFNFNNPNQEKSHPNVNPAASFDDTKSHFSGNSSIHPSYSNFGIANERPSIPTLSLPPYLRNSHNVGSPFNSGRKPHSPFGSPRTAGASKIIHHQLSNCNQRGVSHLLNTILLSILLYLLSKSNIFYKNNNIMP